MIAKLFQTVMMISLPMLLIISIMILLIRHGIRPSVYVKFIHVLYFLQQRGIKWALL